MTLGASVIFCCTLAADTTTSFNPKAAETKLKLISTNWLPLIMSAVSSSSSSRPNLAEKLDSPESSEPTSLAETYISIALDS